MLRLNYPRSEGARARAKIQHNTDQATNRNSTGTPQEEGGEQRRLVASTHGIQPATQKEPGPRVPMEQDVFFSAGGRTKRYQPTDTITIKNIRFDTWQRTCRSQPKGSGAHSSSYGGEHLGCSFLRERWLVWRRTDDIDENKKLQNSPRRVCTLFWRKIAPHDLFMALLTVECCLSSLIVDKELKYHEKEEVTRN